MAPVAFAKTRRDFRSKLLTVAKGHDHLADVDRRISDFDSQFPEWSIIPFDVNSIVIVVEIHLLLT